MTVRTSARSWSGSPSGSASTCTGTTDLSWSRVTDAFGTDLAVAGGKDDFVVVPGNLVAARWMNAETGWVPGVVGHLVRVRADR